MRLFLSELKLAVRAWTHRPGLALAAVVLAMSGVSGIFWLAILITLTRGFG